MAEPMTADELLALAREVLPGLLWYQLPSGATWVGAETALGGAEITCWHNGKGSGLLANLWGASTDTPRAALEALRAELERRHADLERALGLGWVPVAERLPGIGDRVDTWDGVTVRDAIRFGDGSWSHVGLYPTHWRQKCAPPKEEP